MNLLHGLEPTENSPHGHPRAQRNGLGVNSGGHGPRRHHIGTSVDATRSQQRITGRAFSPLVDVPQVSTTLAPEEINVRREEKIGEFGHVLSMAFWTLGSC